MILAPTPKTEQLQFTIFSSSNEKSQHYLILLRNKMPLLSHKTFKLFRSLS